MFDAETMVQSRVSLSGGLLNFVYGFCDLKTSYLFSTD